MQSQYDMQDEPSAGFPMASCAGTSHSPTGFAVVTVAAAAQKHRGRS